jgi:hypothetical protein
MAAEAFRRRHTTGPHTPPRPKPTVNIDHIGPADDPDAGVRRSARLMLPLLPQSKA